MVWCPGSGSWSVYFKERLGAWPSASCQQTPPVPVARLKTCVGGYAFKGRQGSVLPHIATNQIALQSLLIDVLFSHIQRKWFLSKNMRHGPAPHSRLRSRQHGSGPTHERGRQHSTCSASQLRATKTLGNGPRVSRSGRKARPSTVNHPDPHGLEALSRPFIGAGLDCLA